MEPLEDAHLEGMSPLPAPAAAKAAQPVPIATAELVQRSREAIRACVAGRDDRVIAIVGPCSLHDEETALAYADRLAATGRETGDALVVLMRAYFEKPRTTVGWKGLVNDPRLDGSFRVSEGLSLARHLLLEINARGLACASELLDPVTPQYLADLLAWTAIGARTTESQTHREMASGLSTPVGFKNGTHGHVQVALDAIVAARARHHFLGIDAAGSAAIVRTRGNPDGHLVLRGGDGGPNHDPASLEVAARRTAALGIPRGVLVDCSHDNSGKDPAQQPAVCRELIGHVRAGLPGLVGVMLESHLRPGRQDWKPGAALEPGISITDGCIGWEETETLLQELAGAVRARRRGRPLRVAGADAA